MARDTVLLLFTLLLTYLQVDEFLVKSQGLEKGPREKHQPEAPKLAKKLTVASLHLNKKEDDQASVAAARGAARDAAQNAVREKL